MLLSVFLNIPNVPNLSNFGENLEIEPRNN